MKLCNVEIYDKKQTYDFCNDRRQKKISKAQSHFLRTFHTSLSWNTIEHSQIFELSIKLNGGSTKMSQAWF